MGPFYYWLAGGFVFGFLLGFWRLKDAALKAMKQIQAAKNPDRVEEAEAMAKTQAFRWASAVIAGLVYGIIGVAIWGLGEGVMYLMS